MPSYRGHLAGGLVTYLIILQALQYVQPPAMILIQGLFFCLLGALFPDIDVKSKGQKIFYSMLFVVLLLLLYAQMYCFFAVSSVLGTLPMLVRHRGIFHHIWFLLAMAIAGSCVVKIWCGPYSEMMMYNCWFFFAGALSHVVLDRFVTGCKRYFNS